MCRDERLRMVEWEILSPMGCRKTSRQYFNEIARSRPSMTQLEKLGHPVESPLELLNSWEQSLPIAYVRTIIQSVKEFT